jgi:hypothetical protein
MKAAAEMCVSAYAPILAVAMIQKENSANDCD